MKRIKLACLLITAVAIGLSLSACNDHCRRASGHQISQNRPVVEFDRIEVSDGIKLIIRQDTTASTISITADDNLIKYIKTTVSGGKLRIYIKQNICNSDQMVVNVPVRMLSGIKASDGAEVVANGKIIVKDLYLKASDGSIMTLDITANHVVTTEGDAAEITLKG